MDIKNRIPKSFKLFGTTVNVEWDNKSMNDKNTNTNTTNDIMRFWSNKG